MEESGEQRSSRKRLWIGLGLLCLVLGGILLVYYLYDVPLEDDSDLIAEWSAVPESENGVVPLTAIQGWPGFTSEESSRIREMLRSEC